MGARTRVNTIERDLRLALDELLSPEAQGLQFAEMAAEALAEADQTNASILGSVPPNQTFVDGRRGAPLESVRANGVVVREWDLITGVLSYIAQELRQHSPIGRGPDRRPGHPGFFRESHVLFADGVEVNLAGPVPEAEEYVFLSVADYARKVERRRTVYEMVAAAASNRFGRIARINFRWRSPMLSYVQGGRNRNERAAQRYRPGKRAAKDIERQSRVPAIVVLFRE